MPYKSRGHELNTAHALLDTISRGVKKEIPEMFLPDGLCFTKNIFEKIGQMGSKLLIKRKNSDFRSVLYDSGILLAANGDENRVQGFDRQRMRNYTIDVVKQEFAYYQAQVAHVVEEYVKKTQGKNRENFWVITTDLTLDYQEIRQAAHLRREIENNMFKNLNEHCGTKYKRIHKAKGTS